MDFNSEQSSNTPQVKIIIQPNGFLIASVFCTILSWMCSCFIFSALFFGSLSIIFALLSKGAGKKVSPHARAAIIGSSAAMILSAIMTVYSVYSVMNDPQMYAEFSEQYKAMTGISIEEELTAIKSLLPFQF